MTTTGISTTPEQLLFRERSAVVEEITRVLGDPCAPTSLTWWHYLAVVNAVGAEGARDLVQAVLVCEAEGGMKTKDESRRRTPGGIFFALVKKQLGSKRAAGLRASSDQLFEQHMEIVLPASGPETVTPPMIAAKTFPSAPTARLQPAPVEVVIVRRRSP